MDELIDPTLKLFLYDLREGLGHSNEEIAQHREQFKQKLPVSTHASIAQFENSSDADYIELLGQQRFEGFENSSSRDDLKGYYYPVRLNDTYGLLLNCSFKNEDNYYPVSCFSYLKAEIEQTLRGTTATLGQTWMLSGYLPTSSVRKPKEIAQACYPIFQGDWNEDYQGQGYFLGGTIFELWQNNVNARQASVQTSQQQNQHIIIVLYPREAKARNPSYFIFDWLRLFSYRSKILWAYHESQIIKHQMKGDFIVLQDCIKKLKKDDAIDPPLRELELILDSAQNALATYGIDLTYLDYQYRTIETNLHNYQIRLNRIQEKTGEYTIQGMLPEEWVFQAKTLASRLLISDANLSDFFVNIGNIQGISNLNFMKNFSDTVAQSWLLQVQKDHSSLSPGLSLLDSLTNTIRAVIEVDRAKRDRNFQNTVAIVGVGLAASAIIVDLNLGENQKDPLKLFLTKSVPLPEPWSAPTTSLVYGITLGFIAAVLTWLVIHLLPRSR